MTPRQQRIAGLIRSIPDFPQPGVQFKDITPLLGSPSGFQWAIEDMVEALPSDVDVVCGVESRGFIFGAPMALALNVGFVPIRKPGKLPYDFLAQDFELEYGSGVLNMHVDAVKPGQRVLLVDDLLATGGTLVGAKQLIERAGGTLAHVSVLVELIALGGRARLAEADFTSVTASVVY